MRIAIFLSSSKKSSLRLFKVQYDPGAMWHDECNLCRAKQNGDCMGAEYSKKTERYSCCVPDSCYMEGNNLEEGGSVMEIIRERQFVTKEHYTREFVWKHDLGGGFCFDTDKDGILLNMNPEAQVNYDNCINGAFDVIDYGVQKKTDSYWECAIGKCSCGTKVDLQEFTNTCVNCGVDYNMFGQLLADRSQWGEETNETWSECY